jgi:hypothetical protein
VQGYEIRCGQKVVQRGVLDAQRLGRLGGDMGVEGKDSHFHRQGALGHDRANSSQPHDSQRLVIEFGAEELFFLPKPATHRLGGLREVARQGEHHRQGVFGRRHGVCPRRVHDQDAVFSRRFHVDVVHSGPGPADDL